MCPKIKGWHANQPEQRESTCAVLNHYCLTNLFDCVQAKDDWLFVKPDPRAFEYILGYFGIPPDQCAYVGDMPVDFECADKKGVPNISVLSGIFDKGDFLAIGQKKENIINSIADLPEWIKKHRT